MLVGRGGSPGGRISFVQTCMELKMRNFKEYIFHSMTMNGDIDSQKDATGLCQT